MNVSLIKIKKNTFENEIVEQNIIHRELYEGMWRKIHCLDLLQK